MNERTRKEPNMLALRRTVGTELVYTVPPSTETTEIRVMVTEIRGGDTAVLASTAPRSVAIVRPEAKAKVPTVAAARAAVEAAIKR
jgi:sRNA-binding carbon storage regulator CsrA